MTYELPFTEDEVHAANTAWGCNCGPAALAFALQISLDEVRPMLPDFEGRGYTNPTMMRGALDAFGADIEYLRKPLSRMQMYAGKIALVRIQFGGPWLKDGVPAKWASCHTHWVACWWYDGHSMVFDVNSGIVLQGTWELHVIPDIVKTIKRADGSWFPVNIWRLKNG